MLNKNYILIKRRKIYRQDREKKHCRKCFFFQKEKFDILEAHISKDYKKTSGGNEGLRKVEIQCLLALGTIS